MILQPIRSTDKWVFKLKNGEDGRSPRYKARIVIKGYQPKKGVDFDEIFAPVVKMTSIRTVSIAASMTLEIEQLDVKTTFLHGELDKEIYMQQPKGFVEKEKGNLVCRLKKSSSMFCIKLHTSGTRSSNPNVGT